MKREVGDCDNYLSSSLLETLGYRKPSPEVEPLDDDLGFEF